VGSAVDFTQHAKRCATVREAVEDVARRTGKSKYEVAYELMMRVKRGEIAVESGADTALAYALGPGGAWLWAVLCLTAAAAALALYATKPPLLYLRYLIGAFYVLFLPGYVLVEALYPRGDELAPLERLALSIGLSLALVPLVGLALNYTPLGIRLGPVVASLAALTAALAVYATYRKYKAEALSAACRAT
jgi:peptidoglycan/LPS O-acetylase OafA/YrhL